MKRNPLFLLLSQLCLTVFTLCMFSSSALAFSWADYYNNDFNFPRVWGHTGVGVFIDRTSVSVERYDPPCYIIAVNVFGAGNGGYGGRGDYDTERFFYNYDENRMYYDNNPGQDDWVYIYTDYHSTLNCENNYIGEAAFYVAYAMPFYNNCDTSLYNRLDD